MKPVLAALALSAATLPAQAQSVGDCNWLAQAANIVEPWDTYSRVFSNGDVRLALLDAIEPGAVPYHLLLLSPPYDEIGGRMCRVISLEPGIGFHDVHWDRLVAGYDPAVGLTVDVPVELWIDTGYSVVRGLSVTLNQATGAVEAALMTDD